MKQIFFALAALGATLSPALADSEAAGWGSPDRVWQLVEISGEPYPGRVTLSVSSEDGMVGQAPCNRFTMPIVAEYPEFQAAVATTTRMACPELGLEILFFATMDEMNRAEIDGDRFILSDDSGQSMVFHPAED